VSEAPSTSWRRIGAIDVGTNSIRLIVAEASGDGSYRILDDEKETTRLGQGLATSGRMLPKSIERAAAAIARMKSIADGYGVEMLRVIGTCAVREASNREEFLDLVRERCGLTIEPISAEEEADLAQLSVAHTFDLRALAVAVVDIGGGSTEIVLSSGGVVEQVFSIPLGAVFLTEEYGGLDPATGKPYRRMRRKIRQQLERSIGRAPFVPQLMIGTGGTFTSLANIAQHRLHPAAGAGLLPVRARGYEMKRSEVMHLVDWLRKMPLRSRMRVPGLSPERAEIIVAGAALVERTMQYLGVNRLLVHDGGVRDGLLRNMVGTLFPGAEKASARESVDPIPYVKQFAATCGYEERHCSHIARLAGQIFDQLAGHLPAPPGGWSDPANRLVLEAAALLHDVGYLINYSKHHQHSYHLIVHSDLPGFTPRELELVANVARYHRRARPKAKHANFNSLAKADRKLVRRLAAILRIADGLDRNRMQIVRRVGVRVQDDDAFFILEAAENPTVDIWAAASKADLFKDTFGLAPHFEWATGGSREADRAKEPRATTERPIGTDGSVLTPTEHRG
jgi:exopolyphosphatase/guanosine-5'-triphosphate,3'-diphosphate pyrophosphatase